MESATDQSTPQETANRRRPGRLVCVGVTCPLGEVLDLSAKGMRLRRKGFGTYAPGTTMTLKLSDEECAVTVSARVRWVRKLRLAVYEMGLEFMDVSHEQLPALWRLANSANKVLSGTQLKYVRRPR